jgi:hypothetical protein
MRGKLNILFYNKVAFEHKALFHFNSKDRSQFVKVSNKTDIIPFGSPQLENLVSQPKKISGTL